MQFISISAFAIMAIIVSTGTIDASPSPIRIVTPKPGIDYRIRIVTPNPRIRYLRALPDDEQDVQRYSRFVRSADEDFLEAFNPVDEVERVISKRSPERVVINYKPPSPNGPRYARSVDAE